MGVRRQSGGSQEAVRRLPSAWPHATTTFLAFRLVEKVLKQEAR